MTPTELSAYAGPGEIADLVARLTQIYRKEGLRMRELQPLYYELIGRYRTRREQGDAWSRLSKAEQASVWPYIEARDRRRAVNVVLRAIGAGTAYLDSFAMRRHDLGPDAMALLAPYIAACDKADNSLFLS